MNKNKIQTNLKKKKKEAAKTNIDSYDIVISTTWL